MADYLQYPIWAAIDPETLDASLRDELQWFQPLAEPVLRRIDLSSIPSFFIDPETLNEEVTEISVVAEIQQSTQIVLPRHSTALYEPASITDPTALGEDAAPAILDEYQELSQPILPRSYHAAFAAISVIDPETLSEALRDEIQWFQHLAIPVLSRPNLASIPSFFIDTETLGDIAVEVITLDEFQALSLPILPPYPSALFISASEPEFEPTIPPHWGTEAGASSFFSAEAGVSDIWTPGSAGAKTWTPEAGA